MTTIQVGNVAEYDFEYEFAADTPADEARAYREFCDAYSAVAAFFTTEPELVVLPRDVTDERWWHAVQEPLDWRRLRRHVLDTGDARPLTAVMAEDPVLQTALAVAERVEPWGQTTALRALAVSRPNAFNLSRDVDTVRLCDSKAEVVTLFEQARERTGTDVRVPKTTICHDDDETISALMMSSKQGRSAVLKTSHGSGGWGTVVIGPELMASRAACARTLAGIRGGEETFTSWPLVVQELVPAMVSAAADLTADGEITRDGSVALTGVATSLMTGPRYSGCVVSATRSGDQEPWPTIAAFTVAVGEVLAERGYRGWYDVDFVRAANGALYALEINARRTGPCVAYSIASRLHELSEEPRAVAAVEVIRLPRRIAADAAFEHFAAMRAALPDRVIIPTTFMGTDSIRPSIGLAISGRSDEDAVAGLHIASDLLVAAVAETA